MLVRWVEGRHHCLVWDHGFALLASEVSADAAVRVWSDFSASQVVAHFARFLGQATGTDVLSLPSFALAVRTPEGWRFAARGDVTVTVDDVLVRGAGISTWAEQAFAGASSIVMGEAEGVRRPLVGGVVAAAGLSWTKDADADRAASSAVAVAEASEVGGATASDASVASEPEALAPEAVEPEVAEPQAAEPEVAEPEASGAEAAPPEEAEPQALEPNAAEPEASGVPVGSHETSGRPDEEAVPVPVEDVPDVPLMEPAVAMVPAAAPLADEPLDLVVVPPALPDEADAEADDSGPEGEDVDDPDPEAPAGEAAVENDQGQTLLPDAIPDFEASEPEEAPAPPKPGRFAAQYGDTQLFSVQDAAVREPEVEFIGSVPSAASAVPDAPEPLPDSDLDWDGDHDGHTVMAETPAPPIAVEPVPDALPGGPTVLGVECANGHGNPPSRAVCSLCGAAITGEPRRMARPSLGTVRLPNGHRLELTAPVIVGRNPRADRIQGSTLPQLVPLSQGHISGTHLELRLEEWHVLAVDLRSTNGTFLRRHGEAPVRLGERPELLIQGDVLDLGHGVQLILEVLR
ncbi:MAG TPA: FHA domain-containing protein [Ornithinibacter sp.]|nr:FHA domain-containing protein [Ornithinibacter sp.]HQD67803.1 FHA domain-containing protein [Ornithinibacter sp.]